LIKNVQYALFITVLLFAHYVCAEEVTDERKWYIPDYIKTQFAGNIGFFSIGTGYQFFEGKLQTDIFYGYVREKYSGIDIHHITQKNTYNPLRYDFSDEYILSPLLLGLHFSYKVGNNNYGTWLFLPDRYPDNYYFSTSFHGLLSVGAKVHKKHVFSDKIKGMDLYYEISTVDFYLRNFIKESYIKFTDIWSLAIGITLYAY